MARDPVCKMTLLEDRALGFEYKGETYYFCAQGCLDRFKKDPEKYLGDEKADWIRG